MLPLCLPVRVIYRLHCSRCSERDWSLSLTLPCCSVSSSHCAAEEAEATVQGERGGQEAQAAQSPERGKLSSPSLALQLQLQLLLPVSRCYLLHVCFHFLSRTHNTQDASFILTHGVYRFLVSEPPRRQFSPTLSRVTPRQVLLHNEAATPPEMSSFPASPSPRRSQSLPPV